MEKFKSCASCGGDTWETEYPTQELKPCPFCGGELEITKHFREEIWRAIHRCKVMGPMTIDWRDTKEEIIKKWNTRYR